MIHTLREEKNERDDDRSLKLSYIGVAAYVCKRRETLLAA